MTGEEPNGYAARHLPVLHATAAEWQQQQEAAGPGEDYPSSLGYHSAERRMLKQTPICVLFEELTFQIKFRTRITEHERILKFSKQTAITH